MSETFEKKIRVLHISHHVGCMRDHAYVYQTLGFDYEFWKFYKGLFRITQEVANQIWNEKRDYFNSFDFIVTSDTAPLSRIFMENISELKPKMVVWICNRFDYNMENDKSFYEIFNRIAIENTDQVKIVPYSMFEAIWCNLRGIAPILEPITPIGINPIELDAKIDALQTFKDQYMKDDNAKDKFEDINELRDKIFIPIYGNDNHYFHLKDILEAANISCYNGGYNHSSELKVCKGFVTFPEQYSKLITFETIQNEILVFLPSEKFLIKLHPTTQNNYHYWFNSPIGLLTEHTIKLCEWYKFKECRIYFDSIEDLIYKIKNLTPEMVEEKKRWCRYYGEIILRENMPKWHALFQ